MDLFPETNNNQKHEEIAKKFLLATYTVETHISIHPKCKDVVAYGSRGCL